MEGGLSRLPWARQFPRARCSAYSNFLAPTRRFWMQKRKNVSESRARHFTDPSNLVWESLLNHARERDEALKLSKKIQDFCCHPLGIGQWVTAKILNFRGGPLWERASQSPRAGFCHVLGFLDSLLSRAGQVSVGDFNFSKKSRMHLNRFFFKASANGHWSLICESQSTWRSSLSDDLYRKRSIEDPRRSDAEEKRIQIKFHFENEPKGRVKI